MVSSALAGRVAAEVVSQFRRNLLIGYTTRHPVPTASFPGSTQPSYAAEPSSPIRTSGAPVVPTPIQPSHVAHSRLYPVDQSAGMPINATPPPSTGYTRVQMPPTP